MKAQNRLAHLPVENEELNKKIEKSFEYIKNNRFENQTKVEFLNNFAPLYEVRHFQNHG